MMTAEPTTKKQVGRPFQKGTSGNPAGRPKGSRNKFTEKFWKDFAAAWQKLGRQALEDCARDAPKDFVKAAAMLVPRDEKSKVEVEFAIRSDLLDFMNDYKAVRQAMLRIGVNPIVLEAENETV